MVFHGRRIDAGTNLRVRDLSRLPSPVPSNPGFRSFPHPNRVAGRLQCDWGKHEWAETVKMGVPNLICRKCGATILKPVLEHTLGKKENPFRLSETAYHTQALMLRHLLLDRVFNRKGRPSRGEMVAIDRGEEKIQRLIDRVT